MIATVLDGIYSTQQCLDEQAHHNLKNYVENAHRHVQEMAETYGFTLQYGIRSGGYETVSPRPQPSKKHDNLVEV